MVMTSASCIHGSKATHREIADLRVDRRRYVGGQGARRKTAFWPAMCANRKRYRVMSIKTVGAMPGAHLCTCYKMELSKEPEFLINTSLIVVVFSIETYTKTIRTERVVL